jgi:hypothetical protein
MTGEGDIAGIVVHGYFRRYTEEKDIVRDVRLSIRVNVRR